MAGAYMLATLFLFLFLSLSKNRFSLSQTNTKRTVLTSLAFLLSHFAALGMLAFVSFCLVWLLS